MKPPTIMSIIPGSLKVSEQFYSLQGEGPTTGVPAYFLRLTSCNLRCGDGDAYNYATWTCDTIPVWTKGKRKTYEEIIKDFGERFWTNLNMGALLVITGGEPMLQEKQIKLFIRELLKDKQCIKEPRIEIETNGTFPIGSLHGMNIQWNVSPKLSNSGEPMEKRINLEALESLCSPYIDSYFKFVVTEKSDIAEIIQDFQIVWKRKMHRIYLMPGAATREDLINVSAEVAEVCKDFNLKFSNRLQVEIWDKVTGV